MKNKIYLVGTTVEWEVEARSLEEAKHNLYKKLTALDFDVGDVSGFEVPEDDEID